jgi:hypothetical protein
MAVVARSQRRPWTKADHRELKAHSKSTLETRNAGIVPERFQDGISKQFRIAFALACQLNYEFGDKINGWVFAISPAGQWPQPLPVRE